MPVGPTCRLAATARVPVPQPTSKTDSPGSRCPSRSILSRKARSRPSVSSQTSRSYPAAACSTAPGLPGVWFFSSIFNTWSPRVFRIFVRNWIRVHLSSVVLSIGPLEEHQVPRCPISDKRRDLVPNLREAEGMTLREKRVKDRRIQKTKNLLHEALGSLIRE